MANVVPILTVVTAVNSMTISNLARARMNAPRPQKPHKKEKTSKKVVKKTNVVIPELLKEKFEEAWKKQEESLSGIQTTCIDSYSYNTISEYGWTTGEKKHAYADGTIARIESWDDPERDISRYDRLGNLVETISYKRSAVNYDDIDKTSSKYVYYPNSKQKQFEWTTEGIKHFDKDGNEDTNTFLTKQKIATKRIKEEVKTGKTFKKMGKIEKAVAVAFQDKKEMTWPEKLLAKKTTNSQEK